MSLETEQIKVSADKALAEDSMHPNFTEVYKLLSNNATAAEQRTEREIFDQSLHQKYPALNLIGQKDESLYVFDKTVVAVERRSKDDFHIIESKDVSQAAKQNNMSPEAFGQELASRTDAIYAEKKNAKPDSQGSDLTQQHLTLKTPADKAPTVAEHKSDVYVVKRGDCLWNIAEHKLREHNQDKSEGHISGARIQKYVDKIVAANREHIKNPNLIYPSEKVRLPDLEIESDLNPSLKRTNKTKQGSEKVSNQQSLDPVTTAEKVVPPTVQTQKTEIQKPTERIEPTSNNSTGTSQMPDLYSSKRNGGE